MLERKVELPEIFTDLSPTVFWLGTRFIHAKATSLDLFKASSYELCCSGVHNEDIATSHSAINVLTRVPLTVETSESFCFHGWNI